MKKIKPLLQNLTRKKRYFKIFHKVFNRLFVNVLCFSLKVGFCCVFLFA
jgi:hypothetical protein